MRDHNFFSHEALLLTLQGSITLVKKPLLVPDHYSLGENVVVPMWAGEEMQWQVEESSNAL